MFRKLHDPGSRSVRLFVDDRQVVAESGEMLAAVLLRQPERWTRTTPVSNSPRAPYCLMGVCFDCLVEVDGIASVQSCQTPVHEGMRVRRQQGCRGLPA